MELNGLAVKYQAEELYVGAKDEGWIVYNLWDWKSVAAHIGQRSFLVQGIAMGERLFTYMSLTPRWFFVNSNVNSRRSRLGLPLAGSGGDCGF